MREGAAAPNNASYPEPLAKYDEVIANPKLFLHTLEKLHASMGTKFMIPIIGGKEIDLCRLFIEVTSRGGFEKLIEERRWKEVTAAFDFPSTATNASFVLRKYYSSLLYHYEQIYYFKANRGTPAPAGFQHSRVNTAELPIGSSVVGVIDGKFDSGYIISVSLGSETLNGVVYEVPQISLRSRRKKSEIKRRDPAHPKPNRSGYNFFFAEQHARLKLLNQAKVRDISRTIGELWNNLKEHEKSVYQEKALKDKERYKAEMEDYREKLKMGHVISDAMPLQQPLPEAESGLVDVDIKSPDSPEESSSGGSDEYAVEDMNTDAAEASTYVESDNTPSSKEGDYHCEGAGDVGVSTDSKDE